MIEASESVKPDMLNFRVENKDGEVVVCLGFSEVCGGCAGGCFCCGLIM